MNTWPFLFLTKAVEHKRSKRQESKHFTFWHSWSPLLPRGKLTSWYRERQIPNWHGMVSKAFLQSKGQVMVKGCWETEPLDGLSSVGGSWSLHRGSDTQGCRHSGAAPKWHFTSRSATVMAFQPLLKQSDWPSLAVEIFIGGNFFFLSPPLFGFTAACRGDRQCGKSHQGSTSNWLAATDRRYTTQERDKNIWRGATKILCYCTFTLKWE